MLFGYEERTNVFTELARSGRMGQAYLFFGDEGVGKRTFARTFARFLETGTFEESGAPLVDAVFVAPDEKGTIPIAAVREVRQFLFEMPFRAPRRTVVVENAGALTDQAESAMLKVVEEPPAHALIVMTAENPAALFPPLASRFTKVYFPRMPKARIEEILRTDGGLPATQAKRIARASFGRMGRALRLLRSEAASRAENELVRELEERILFLYTEGTERNARELSWLLAREEEAKRFNLNPTLQKKAIAHFLASS